MKKEFVTYAIKFNKVSSRKSGGVWLVDLHSFKQYLDLYRTKPPTSVDKKNDKLYP